MEIVKKEQKNKQPFELTEKERESFLYYLSTEYDDYFIINDMFDKEYYVETFGYEYYLIAKNSIQPNFKLCLFCSIIYVNR